MSTEFVEADCTFEHNGRKFESGGAWLVNGRGVVYMSSDMKTAKTWHGETLGRVVVISSWRINSAWSDRMYAIRVTIDGIVYVGRTMGAQMSASIRQAKRQS